MRFFCDIFFIFVVCNVRLTVFVLASWELFYDFNLDTLACVLRRLVVLCSPRISTCCFQLNLYTFCTCTAHVQQLLSFFHRPDIVQILDQSDFSHFYSAFCDQRIWSHVIALVSPEIHHKLREVWLSGSSREKRAQWPKTRMHMLQLRRMTSAMLRIAGAMMEWSLSPSQVRV